jgi:predicted lipoprotein with Yx(FWY)xxD motif
MRRAVTVLAVSAGLVLASSPAAGQAASRPTVKTRSGSLGTFLVGPNGRTLYLFKADTTKKSTCYDACAVAWPPLLTSGRPKAAGKARKSLLGTSMRRDGKRQVTYKGHPLYYFIQDKMPGDTNGQDVDGFGAEWYAVQPNGRAVRG